MSAFQWMILEWVVGGLVMAFVLWQMSNNDSRTNQWLNRRSKPVAFLTILIVGFILTLGVGILGQIAMGVDYQEKYTRHFYGRTLTFSKYIYMPTPDPGDAVAFTDETGTEQRVWCNDYLSAPTAVDKMYFSLKPGQKVTFAATGFSTEDPRPVPVSVR